MQEANNLVRSRILVVIAISAILLLVIAKIWQKLAQVTLLPLVWSINNISLAIVIAITIVSLSSFLYSFWSLYRESVDVYVEDIVEPLLWWDLIWLGLLPGLSEELLFRGVMLSAFGQDLIAVIFSSLIFGILHLRGFQYWPYSFLATLVSLVLGYSAIITENLLVPIIIHILINFFSCLLWKYNKTRTVS